MFSHVLITLQLHHEHAVPEIAGWGTLYSSGPTPEVLQQARVKLLSNEKCEENYTSTITGSMICAAGRSTEGITDTCQGDSGGPLVCKEGAAQRYILRGVTSWGGGCAYEGFPGVYGRVVSVLSWIGDAMDGKVRKAYAADTQEKAWLFHAFAHARCRRRSSRA